VSIDGAIRAARMLQPFDLTWLEEPTIPDDLSATPASCATAAWPIAAGENLRSLWEFKLLVAGEGVSYPSPT
jgi:L-alanine-DL-glutamate epimerase-like enolase superfamily enzyme